MVELHIVQRLFESLLHFCRDAAAAMPLMIVLSLVMGRRGHGAFCLSGARVLSMLCITLACLGLLLPGCQLLHIITLLQDAGHSREAYPLWSPLMLPYSLGLTLWLSGLLCCVLLLRCFSARQMTASVADGSYAMTIFRPQLWLCALACLSFFASYVVQVWPFASLPEGMSLGQAASAIIRDRAHHYFSALAPAGAVALFCLPLARKRLKAFSEPTLWEKAARWCALWAVAGYIPFWLNLSATCLGYALRGGADLSRTLLMLLLPLSGAIICWAILLSMRSPLRRFWLAYLGFALLLFFFLQRSALLYATVP